MFSDDFHWTLNRSGSSAILGVDVKPVLPVDYRFIIQSLLLMTIRLYGWLLGEDPLVKSVSFSFARNATDESLAYLFGNRIDYECEGNAFRLDGADADARLSCSRDQIALMLKDKRHLFLLSRRKNPLSQEVRRLLPRVHHFAEFKIDQFRYAHSGGIGQRMGIVAQTMTRFQDCRQCDAVDPLQQVNVVRRRIKFV